MLSIGRAACASWRLSDLSPYWRWLGAREHFDADAVDWMRAASEGPDPTIAKLANKYHGVYAERREHKDPDSGWGIHGERFNPQNY